MKHQSPTSVVIWFCLAFSMLIETPFLLAHLKGKEYHYKTGERLKPQPKSDNNQHLENRHEEEKNIMKSPHIPNEHRNIESHFKPFRENNFDAKSKVNGEGQKIAKTNAKQLAKTKLTPNSEKARSRSKLKRQRRQVKPPTSNPKKPVPNDKQTRNKTDGALKSSSIFGTKNRGEKCSSNQECFSTNCVFPGERVGKQPKPRPKSKPNTFGSRSINSRSNKTIPNPQQKPNLIPLTGMCQTEIEQDPVPKKCPGGFKEAARAYTDSIRTKSSMVFRNYDSSECAEICRESPGCESFLYRQDMKYEDKKDEENGCFLYYESSDVPANQFKRIGPKIQSYNEIACENLSYKMPCRNDQDCKATIKCVKPPPNPKKPKPKGKIMEKVCAGTQKPCKTPEDCSLRHCNKQKCQKPKLELRCFSHEDCKLAPKCKVNPTGKQLPGKPKPKVCEGNKSKDCTNDIDCKVDGCKGKICSNVEKPKTGTEPTDNKCNNQCNKCVKDKDYKDYYQILCGDFDKYLKCQSKCVSSEAKTPFECIQTPTCVKTCESNCKKLWPTSIPYDAYCGMMDYIYESPRRNPYNDEASVKKWIASYYFIRKEKGNLRKGCTRDQKKNRILASRDGKTKPQHWWRTEESGFDNDVQIWEISMEQLQEAYKTTAMDRHLPWTTEEVNDEKCNCIPLFRRGTNAGSFPRRIPWLYVDDGCSYRAYLFSIHLIKFLNKKYPEKNFDPPKKHFIFGDLIYETDNAQENGRAEWGFHVALAVKIRNSDPELQNTLYILDPSLRSTPLPKAEYHQLFTESGLSTLRGFVTCAANTYGKWDNCIDPVAPADPGKDRLESQLLDLEWALQKAKGRNPKHVLGDKWQTGKHYVFQD